MEGLITPGLGSPLREFTKRFTFTGLANFGLTGSACTFLTVTGTVYVVALIPVCAVDLGVTGAPTITLGVTGNDVLFLAATLGSVIDAGEAWINTTPAPNGLALPPTMKDIVVSDDVIGTVAVGATSIDSGSIDFTVFYRSVNGGAVS